MTTTGGGAISMQTLITSISTKAKDLNTEMTTLSSKKDLDPTDMFQLQYAMGQYNSFVESFSAITKGITDSMKSIAQRSS